METIKDLGSLFLHYIANLYAAEKQINDAMPAVIKRAKHQSLKNALQHHQTISKDHLSRLEIIPGMLKEKERGTGNPGSDVKSVSKAMQGLLEEATELLNAGIDDSVIDAAIIGCVQKIEHYEICTYGTALAYATQLQLKKAAALLEETLNEEYDADDLLTSLATAALNKEALTEGQKAGTVEPVHKDNEEDAHLRKATQVSISERTIQSPGGRAGTSHRRYGSGESRGH